MIFFSRHVMVFTEIMKNEGFPLKIMIIKETQENHHMAAKKNMKILSGRKNRILVFFLF